MSHLDTEIAAVEHRIADERAESLEAFDEYRRHVRDQATSFTSLAVLAGVGFVAGTLLQRRARNREAAGAAAASPAMKLVGLALGALPAVVRAFAVRRRPSPAAPRPADESNVAVESLRGGAT